ncbi:MAG: chromosomal replication initiator protein DnaA [Verrucomicrobiota bacterium]
MPDSNEFIWKQICQEVRRKVSEDTFRRWFAPTKLLDANERELVVEVPNQIFQVWIDKNYLGTLHHSIGLILQGPREVVYEMRDPGLIDAQSNGEKPATHPLDLPGLGAINQQASPDDDLPMDVVRSLRRAGLNNRYRFDTFVVGANTEFAHAASASVGERPAHSYNPLFIHGPTGLGKTHLLHAIGRTILINNPKAKVIFVTSETFTNEFIDALANDSLTKFRNRYRRADVLLIDDIQFFGGKERSQDEFFHTFNTLTDGRRQIILTSDCPASEIANLEKRLVTRCEWGLTAELVPPDTETRLAILRKKMEELNVKLDDHIVEFLADRIRKSVRRLEGGLMRLASFASLSGGKALTDAVIERLLKDILKEEGRRRVSVSRVQKEVSDFYDIRLADMTSHRRPANIAFPRQVAMYLTRTLTDMSLVEIGQSFGGRDHGTVIYACKQVEKKMATTKEIRQAVSILSNRLSG